MHWAPWMSDLIWKVHELVNWPSVSSDLLAPRFVLLLCGLSFGKEIPLICGPLWKPPASAWTTQQYCSRKSDRRLSIVLFATISIPSPWLCTHRCPWASHAVRLLLRFESEFGHLWNHQAFAYILTLWWKHHKAASRIILSEFVWDPRAFVTIPRASSHFGVKKHHIDTFEDP